MYDGQSLSHTKWECKYHIVWIPKYRKKAIFEGHLMSDHVHILISIPPKYAVSQVVGFIKGKSAIQIAWNFQGRKKNLLVSTSGQEDNMCQRLVRMRMLCESIFKSKRKRTSVLSN